MKSKNFKIDCILVFLLIALSGNLLFTRYIWLNPIFALVLFVYFHFHQNKISSLLWQRLYSYAAIFLFIFVFQYLVLDFVSIDGAINFLSKIVFGGIVITYVNKRFRYVYLKVIYYLAVISLVGYGINLLGFEIPTPFEQDKNASLIFYNQHIGTLNQLRNNGMFWEGGAHAGFILLVPLLYLDSLKQLFLKRKKECLVLFTALITTYSTTGYIVLAGILVYHLFFNTERKFLKVLYTTLFLVIATLSYNSFDFLGEKIEGQSKNFTTNKAGENFSNDRFGALKFDLYYINKHPLVGNGLHGKTRYADHQYLIQYSSELGHGNGFSNFLACMGIPAMLIMFILLFKRLPFNIRDKILFISCLLLLYQGEQFLNFPLFLSLPFLIISKGYNLKIHKTIKKEKQS